MSDSSQPTLCWTSLVDLGLQRELKPGHSGNQDWIRDSYDFSTFWYDAYWRENHIYVVCPKLFGVYDAVAAGNFSIDGEIQKRFALIKKFETYDILKIHSKYCPQRIEFQYNGKSVKSGVSNSEIDSTKFEGLNCAVILSKDNELSWIEDFARYHKQRHGLEQILFFDNNSTLYSIEEVRETLRRAGLESPLVVSAPFRYGLATNRSDGKVCFSTAYLQSSILNLARTRFLYNARAVLQCDIDELVWCDSGSIFDLAVSRRTGYVKLGVEWRYPPPDKESGFRHSDHIYKKQNDERCRAKYCIAPKGWFGWSTWGVHSIGLFKRRGALLKTDSEGAWHFNAIRSSPWRGVNKNEQEELSKDKRVMEEFEHVTWSDT